MEAQDRHTHECFGNAITLEDVHLAFRSAAAVTAHGWNKERPGSRAS